ncbi:MAG TPA: hypothetical protein VNN22_18045 [Verrucomicrobiae bacterium]|nr:hypothetical protein [Verrucomicrobiae bacterium]
MQIHFLSPMRMLAVVSVGAVAILSSSACADEVILHDDQLLAAFDSDSGALTRLENKSTHWVVEQRPELGVSFQLNALWPDHKDISVLGSKQHAAEVKKISDHEVRLQWKDLASERGNVLPITLTADVTLTNGGLMFDAALENNSSLMVRSVDYPYLGDLNKAPDGGQLAARHMWYGNLQSREISSRVAVMSRQSLICLIQSPKAGLYVEMHDPTQPYLLNFIFEPRGSAKSTNNPAHIEFHTTHLAYVQPHSTMKLAPVVMHFYSGDWHAGVDLYKEWRATWFKPPHVPAWIKDVNSWQQLQIGSPEQDWRVPYTNLISYARECADNGVSAIQLVGWNNGGQDGGDPAQDTDPGLGTWQQLHDFIAQSQGMGVKIILFAKLNWADLTTAWYTNELCKYECMEADGKRSEQGGYAYFTPTQLAGIGVHRRAVMDFQDPAYRAVATHEFEKILALGSAGWLWDEVCHHANVLYSWAPNHGYTPPGYIYGGDLPLGKQLRDAADKVDPDFLFSGEGPQDWLLQEFPCSYFRINADSTPVDRYIDSQAPLMVTVTGFDDREMLNLILMDRYIISYEPYNFKGFLTDYPLTLAYGRKIDALRRKYKTYLWNAEFRDTLGASVTANGSSRYSVFNTTGGKRAVVVVNMEYSKAITARVDLPNPGKLVVATPEHPGAKVTDGTLKIPARSAAVVMER